MSHLLINTWSGNLDSNNQLKSSSVVGLSTIPNESGQYYSINGSPKLLISGGLTLTPNIENAPVYLEINPTSQLNFATDKDTSNTTSDELSKAPSDIIEVGETTAKIIPSSSFGLPQGTPESGGEPTGWFTRTSNNVDRPGIFRTNTLGSNRNYKTYDFSANALDASPTNIKINTQIYPENGGFTKEEQAFPLELLFTYPFTIPENLRPNKFTSVYNNSDGEISVKKFDNFRGLKRFSKLYALSIKGDNGNYNNINFRNRIIFQKL